jgi:AraC family transcriptional regulator
MQLAPLLEHIEQNLGDDLSLEALARRWGLSPYHFHRTFRASVGEAPIHYVRRLRLEAAATRLKLSTRSVTDVAFDVGYESLEGFIRAFHARFGTSPQRFRAARPAPHLPAGFAPRIVVLPPRRLACVRHVGPYDRTLATFERLAGWADSRGLLGREMLAAYRDDQDITAASHTRCEVALAVGSRVEGCDEVVVRGVPGGEFAVFEHTGDVAERRRLYEVAFRRWLPSIGRRAKGAPPFETYAVTPRGVDQVSARIHIPLRPR